MRVDYSGTGFCFRGSNGCPTVDESKGQEIIPSPHQKENGIGEMCFFPEDNEETLMHWEMRRALTSADEKKINPKEILRVGIIRKIFFDDGYKLFKVALNAPVKVKIAIPLRPIWFTISSEYEHGTVLPNHILRFRKKNAPEFMISRISELSFGRIFSGEGKIMILHDPSFYKDFIITGEYETVEIEKEKVVSWTNPVGARPEWKSNSVIFAPRSRIYTLK